MFPLGRIRGGRGEVRVSALPVFETPRLILRAVRESDAPSYERYFVDYAVISELSAAVPWPYPKGGVMHYIRSEILPEQGKDRWVWGIFLKENPTELIGNVDLWRAGTPGNRGFWLGRPFWGRGLMTEAVEPVIDHAFQELGFEKLVFSNAFGNAKSRRIKEKTGATLIGKRPARFVNPRYTEAEVWELTREAWGSFKESGRALTSQDP
jgi:[ribosomal protein S5]-alanine N-acetyltransferase